MDALTRVGDIGRPQDGTLELLASAATDPRHAASLTRLAEGEDAADGTLGRLDTASRDRARKVSVQDGIRENAAEIWRWLGEGAHVFVCGDAPRSAKDVDATLRRVAISEGGLTEDGVRDWIARLAPNDRYKRDVS